MADPSSAPSPVEVFRSRVDVWLVAAVFAITLGGLAVPMFEPASRGGLTVESGAVIAGGAAVLLSLLFYLTYRGTEYVLDSDFLFVKCLGSNWHVNYRDITGVTYTANPLSSPALSLRRLQIDYGRNAWLLISPTDRDAFVASLQRRVPGLTVRR